MLSLMPRLRSHFDPLQERLNCFCRYGVQVEGWFKGELLLAFDQMRREGAISNFDREVRSSGKRIDVRVNVAGTCHWIELKHWLIGVQRGTKYGPDFYLSDPSTVGISKDVDALRACPSNDEGWLLILTTARPSTDGWLRAVERHNAKFKHSLVPRTQPDDFPSTYFFGLLEVGRPNV